MAKNTALAMLAAAGLTIAGLSGAAAAEIKILTAGAFKSAAEALMKVFTAPDAAAVFKAKGMNPAT